MRMSEVFRGSAGSVRPVRSEVSAGHVVRSIPRRFAMVGLGLVCAVGCDASKVLETRSVGYCIPGVKSCGAEQICWVDIDERRLCVERCDKDAPVCEDPLRVCANAGEPGVSDEWGCVPPRWLPCDGDDECTGRVSLGSCGKVTCDGDADYCILTGTDNPCNDGNECTLGDKCGLGTRCSGKDVECHPTDQCEDLLCNPADGVCDIRVPRDGESCNDDDPCTDFDVCEGLTCRGRQNTCDVCKTCEATSGMCVPKEFQPGTTLTCNDGDPCTAGDRCEDGSCVGTWDPGPDCPPREPSPE